MRWWAVVGAFCGIAAATETAEQQLRRAVTLPPGPEKLDLLESVLERLPRSARCRWEIGVIYMFGQGEEQERGFRLLEEVFDPQKVDDPVDLKFPKALIVAGTIGRFRWSRKEFSLAKKFIELALQGKPDDVCLQTQLATMLDPFPESMALADQVHHASQERLDKLLAKLQGANPATLDVQFVQSMPGAKEDPYNHCVMSAFYQSFYYRGDAAKWLSTHFGVAAAIWPELLYKSKRAQEGGGARRSTEKVRLGVVSGFLLDSSVGKDFSGMLDRLSRDVFEITYIYAADRPAPSHAFYRQMPGDKFVLLTRDPALDHSADPHEPFFRAHRKLEALDLDMLLYLDHTMSPFVQRLAMAKLAPVQAASHGHPMTTGIPPGIMDYFISWAGAELALEQAQQHYTEKLVLLPADQIHQYYEPQVGKEAPLFAPIVQEGKAAFQDFVPADGNWYLCMQKPFKLHPEFDILVAGIMRADPGARIILHKEDHPLNEEIFVRRLKAAGCDMQRVHFVPVQPHPRLLALYSLSQVVLDSYPAGGCTTTREVLELGKVVVTLPAKYLGSRWSYGIYNILGSTELTDLVVAKDEKDYVSKAVAIGTSASLRNRAELLVRENVHKIFQQSSAVEEWSRILVQIAPPPKTDQFHEEL